MSKEERTSFTLNEDENIGEVQIADEVVAVIAGLAAMDVKGVASLTGGATRETVDKQGMKSVSKGVKVEVVDGVVTVMLSLNLMYGYNIGDVTEKVQNKVKSTVENMTGLEVADVNIRVSGVEVSEEES